MIIVTSDMNSDKAPSSSSCGLYLSAAFCVQGILGLIFADHYLDVEWIKRTWLGNDFLTLTVAVPMLTYSVIKLKNYPSNSIAMLVYRASLCYGFYNYAYYMLGARMNVFFPLYIGNCVFSTVLLIREMFLLDAVALVRHFDDKTPVRLASCVCMFVAVGLGTVWLGMWAAHQFAGADTPVETDAFQLVAALDLSIITAGFAAGSILLWNKSPWGYIICTCMSIQGALYLAVLTLNTGISIYDGRAEFPGEIPIWGTLMFIVGANAIVLLNHVNSS